MIKSRAIRQTLRFMQWTALTFILTLGAVMLYDAAASNRILQSGETELTRLKEKDVSDPALAETIRDLDYLYRSAYFQSHDKQNAGFLLLGIAFLLLCALKSIEFFFLSPELKVPEAPVNSPENERRQVLVFSLAGLLLLFAAAAALRLLLPQDSAPDKQTAALPPSGEKTEAPAANQEKAFDFASALEAETKEWPQFRGSVLPNQFQIPAKWDFQQKWTAKIPLAGFNSPVAWGGSVFVSGADAKERAIFCFDGESGALKWKAAGEADLPAPDVTDDTGYAAPTLCVDAERVYGIFAAGEILCCGHDGKVLWSKQLPKPEISYGYASSPLLLGDRLIIQYDLEQTQTLYALNVKDGSTLWKTVRSAASSWASPIAWMKDGAPMIFTVGSSAAEAFDARTGKSVWRQDGLSGEVAASPSFFDGLLYFSNTSAMTGAFSASTGEILFRNDDVPAPDVASPVTAGGCFLLFSSGGSVIAIDAKTGKELYEKEFDNGFYASPVVLQGKIAAVNLDGDLFLLSASTDDLTEEGKYSIGKKIVSVPAFHRGRVIVRTDENELIGLEAKP